MILNNETIDQFRESSRQVVRELGFLQNDYDPVDITHSQCHAIIEINKCGMIGVGQLADKLKLDKSTTSRVIKNLEKKKLVQFGNNKDDKRFKPISLTKLGEDKLVKINEIANDQTFAALELLSGDELNQVVDGMKLYAQALNRSKRLSEFTIRPIEAEDNEAVAHIIVQVMTEFGAVGEGYSISDDEVKDMYSAYSGNKAKYFVVVKDDKIMGGAGVGPLPGADPSVCELKKMYYNPEARGIGLGQKMMDLCLQTAKELGYSTVYLETLKHMNQARNLYQKNQFTPIDKPLGHTGHFGCDSWMIKEL